MALKLILSTTTAITTTRKRCFSLHQSCPRPYRSVLFVPASNERALEKVKNVAADAVVIDLEDAVAPMSKDKARENVLKVLNQGNLSEKKIAVRLNSQSSPWGEEDLRQIANSSTDAIVIPKVSSAQCLDIVSKKMEQYKCPSNMELWAMIETPLGVLHVNEIASYGKRLKCLLAGTSDLSKELNCSTQVDRMPLLTSLSLVVLAAKAYHLVALDGVHLDMSDDKGFLQQCKQGRQLGFDGKTLIHPKMIKVANDQFSPTIEELDHARLVIEEYTLACRSGNGVAVLHGKLIENLHVEAAKNLLEKHRIIQGLETDFHS